jgi:sugar-specific transcriptional regulator TrmB
VDTKILEEIGLTKSEANVYVALLSLGASSTGKIIDESGAASSKIYEILDRLIKKGLASYIIEGGIKIFEAAPPSRIKDYLEEKKITIAKQEADIDILLPELELKQKLAAYKSDAQIFKGNKGWETAFEDILDTLSKGEEVLISGVWDFDEDFQKKIIKFHKRRSSKGIRARFLISKKAQEFANKMQELEHTQIKYLPESMSTPAIFLIYGGKVLISLPKEKIFFRIDNKDAAESFSSNFETLWNQKVTTYQGKKEIQKLFETISDLGDYDSFAEGMKIIDTLGEKNFIKWQKGKKAKGIKSRVIMGTQYKNDVTATKSFAKIKFIPGYENPGALMIFKDKILNIILSEDPVAFVIESEEVANNNRTYFNFVWDQQTQVYEGKEAIQALFLESAEWGDYCAFGEGMKIHNTLGETVFKEWQKIKKQNNVTAKVLMGVQYKDSKTVQQSNAEFKFLQGYENPGVVNIYEDRVVQVNFTDKPIAFVINNKDIAQNNRTYFDMAWNKDVQVVNGMEAATQAFYDMLADLNAGEEYYVLGASFRGAKNIVQPFFKEFHTTRVAKGVKAKFLFTAGTKKIVKENPDLYAKLAKTRFLQEGIYEGMQINIYRNKLLIFVWRDIDPVVFIFEDEKMSQSFKSYFDTLWDQETSISKGFPALEEMINTLQLNHLEGKPYKVLGANLGKEGPYKEFFKDIMDKRETQSSKCQLLFNQDAKKDTRDLPKYYYNNSITETKFLPYETKSPMEIFIDKESTHLVIQEEEPTIISINNKSVTKAFENHFDSLWNQETKMVKGLDAVQDLFEEMLEAGHCDFIGASGYFIDHRPDFIKDWEQRAIKKGLTIRNIVDPGVKGHKITQFPFIQTKYTLQKEFSEMSVILISGDRVAISNWTEDEPTAIILTNKKIVEMYKKQFESLWNQTSYTLKGKEGVEFFFEQLLEQKEIRFIGGNWGMKEFFPEIAEKFFKAYAKNNIIWKDLLEEKTFTQHKVNAPLYEAKILPKEFQSPHTICIFGNSIANILWDGKNTTITITENKKIKDSYMQQFNYLWKKSK